MENPYQEQPTPQRPVSSDEIYAAQVQEDRIKNLIGQISPENQLLELQWRIRGYVRNPVTGEWKKVNEDSPEPNPLLVSRYISFLSSILSQNVTLSNFSSDEINSLMDMIIKWVSDDLDNNASAYGLEEDYDERSRIGWILLNNIFAVFKRGQNGMESRRIFKSINVNESNTSDNNRKGVMDFLKVWK